MAGVSQAEVSLKQKSQVGGKFFSRSLFLSFGDCDNIGQQSKVLTSPQVEDFHSLGFELLLHIDWLSS